MSNLAFVESSWTCCVFFAWKSVIAREFLLKVDTSLAIATSGLRTNLLFEIPPFRKPPIQFSREEAPSVYKFRFANVLGRINGDLKGWCFFLLPAELGCGAKRHKLKCLALAWHPWCVHHGLRPRGGRLAWKGWFETVPCRATLNTPFSALCPRILGTRFTNYGLRMFRCECKNSGETKVSGERKN